MNKILFSIALTVLCTCAVSAQVTLRPFIGLNSSSLTDIDSANFNNKVGYQLGGDLQIGSKFYIQPGVQFEFVKNEVNRVTGTITKYSRTNMRIPVLVGYSFGGIDANWALRIFTGPNATFNLSDKTEGSNSGNFDLNKIIWGWNAGVGVDILSILFIDFGYQFGLSDVFDGLNDAPRNNLFYANAGLRFRF